MCESSCRTVTVARRESVKGPSRPSWPTNGWSSSIDPSLANCMMATAVNILDTLAMRNRVSTVATLASNGFSMPNAAVCSTWPSRMTATPAPRSPRSTVAPAITVSKAALLNGALFTTGVVVTVVVGVVVVAAAVVAGAAVVVVAGAVVVVGWVESVCAVRAVAPGDVETDSAAGLAAVSPDELRIQAKPTTARPAAPIIHTRLAIVLFSPPPGPNRRHPMSHGYSPAP